VVLSLLVVIVLAQAPPVRELAAWVDAHRAQLLLAVGAVIAVAVVLFFIGILKLLMDRGQPLTHTEAADVKGGVNLAPQPVFARATRYRVIGQAIGSGGSDSFTLQALKAAWRSGAVSGDPVWRRRAVTTVGALLLIAGILALLVAVGAPWLKLGAVVVFVFVFGRLALAWSRAKVDGS
jgi:hypothetical protein